MTLRDAGYVMNWLLVYFYSFAFKEVNVKNVFFLKGCLGGANYIFLGCSAAETQDERRVKIKGTLISLPKRSNSMQNKSSFFGFTTEPINLVWKGSK